MLATVPTRSHAGTRHGVWSKRVVDPLTAELVAGMLEVRPDLERHGFALMAWARAEVRCVLLAEWQAEHGLLDAKGNAPGARYVGQFERIAADLRSKLGLDPMSEAELLATRADAERQAFDLDAIRARGREALAARST